MIWFYKEIPYLHNVLLKGVTGSWENIVSSEGIV